MRWHYRIWSFHRFRTFFVELLKLYNMLFIVWWDCRIWIIFTEFTEATSAKMALMAWVVEACAQASIVTCLLFKFTRTHIERVWRCPCNGMHHSPVTTQGTCEYIDNTQLCRERTFAQTGHLRKHTVICTLVRRNTAVGLYRGWRSIYKVQRLRIERFI